MKFLITTSAAICMITCLLTLNPMITYGQEERTIYLDKRYRVVSQIDSAEYIRILSPSDTPGAPYHLTEKYRTGEAYRQGFAKVDRGHVFLTGMIVTYQKNGKKISEEHFSNGRQIGLCRYYYGNGNLKSQMEIFNNRGNQQGPVLDGKPPKMQLFYDSLGTLLVKDGNGYAKDVSKEGDEEEGAYKDGYKDGSWKGSFMKHKYTYVEQYKAGKLRNGTTSDGHGKAIPYRIVAEMPTYPGGPSAMYQYIGGHYEYPKEALRAGVAGTVLLTFVVDADGDIRDIKVLRDLGYGTGDEGKRVLRKSKKWIPGKMRGIPVRVVYSLPIKLNLGRR